MLGLCPECILNHARHDFVAANEAAANEVKSIVRQAQRVCKKQAKSLKEVGSVTEAKLKAISARKREEFSRLNTVIGELKAMLDERERYLHALLENEVRDIEERLTAEVKLINGQHDDYLEMFKELRTLGERFSVSSEIGIVSGSNMAWLYHKKTQELINLMQLRQSDLYVVEL
jgi:hypothetical protein